jgi:DnaB-like helicase C terminal domain
MLYRRLTRTLNDKGILIDAGSDVYNYIHDDADYYLSTYLYTEEHKKQFEQNGSVAGIQDVTTNKIWWDFDSEHEPELARKDTIELVSRLVKHVQLEDIIVAYSGNKGFGVELNLTSYLTPKDIKSLAFELASDLSTFDVKMYNASRILRVIATRHQKTGLYKTPLTPSQLQELSVDNIMELAKKEPTGSDSFRWAPVPLWKEPSLNTSANEVKLPIIKDAKFDINDIDFTHKIKGWSNCKWAVLNGYQVKQNDRHEKLLSIVAHSKYLNNTKNQAYYNAKMADEYGVQIYGGSKSSKEDLWLLVESVYADSWKGGTYSCKDGKTPWLTSICESLGIHKCKHKENDSLVNVENVFSDFVGYAKDIEKNTIKTGIDELDDRLRLVIGQMVGVLGAPSSGKTAMALEILENTSKNNLLSVFYSLDMASSELFQKIAQRVTGYSDDKLFDIFKHDPGKTDEIAQKVNEAYKNVKFCFDTGVSVEKIEQTIDEFESTTNQKVKLLLLDYNELLSSPYSDMTASSGYNAGALKKLTNTRGLCTMSLLQPPKVIGDAGDEITSYRNIKGSSLLEQCFSTIIGIYRPGFSAENDSVNDKFMVMNVLKNRLGRLFSLQFYWDGLRGKISRIDEFGKEEIRELKEKKKSEKSEKGGLNF